MAFPHTTPTDGSRTPRLPPGPRLPRSLQRVGWFTRRGPFLERCQARYGDVFTLRFEPGFDVVVVAHPEGVEQVFKGDPKVFRAGEGNVFLEVLGETSLFLLDEDEHLRMRRVLLPPLHGKALQRHGELMTRLALEEVARWPVGEVFRLRPRMRDLTLDVIMHAVFGLAEGPRFDDLRAALGRPSIPDDDFILEELESRRRDPDVAERGDIMSMLVQARYDDGQPLSNKEIRDQLVTVLLAGHETSTNSLAWAVERLVHNRDKLARLHETVAGGDESYLEAVIEETHRIRPVVWNTNRRLSEPVEIGGHLLPAGANVAPDFYLLHRRPDLYPDPLAFRPERFLERPPGTYTWAPFGGGTRRCVGASFAMFEMRRILSTIVSNATLRAADPTPEPAIWAGPTARPGRGAEVVVEEKVGST